MSGILHDGLRNKSSHKSTKSPNTSGGKRYLKNQYEIKHDQKYQQQYQQEHQQQFQQIQPRAGTSSGRLPQSQRSRSNSRYPPHQYQQMMHHHQQQQEMQLQQFSSAHDHLVIEPSHSNHSQGSRHSSQSKQSSSSASGQKRQQHQHQHRRTGSNNSNSAHSQASSNTNSRYQQQQQHKRVPSANSEPGSIYSLPTATSRSTISDPSGHSRGGGYQSSHSIVNNDSRRIHSNHQYTAPERRDPHGETTNTRRMQNYSKFNSPPRHHHSAPNQALHPHGLTTSFPASPMVEPTPIKSSGASVNSYHSRGSTSYNSGVPNIGKSSVASTTSVVSKDKQAIKSTKKVIEGMYHGLLLMLLCLVK